MKLIIPATQAEIMVSHYVSCEMQIQELGNFPKVTFISSDQSLSGNDPHFIVEYGDGETEVTA